MRSVMFLLTLIFVSDAVNAQTYHALQNGNFLQRWTDTNLITVNHNWANVPAVMGFRGDNLVTVTRVDPQTVLADQTTVHVLANQTSPDFLSSGGVAEFHLSNPSVALQGSGTADAPFVVLYLNTTGINGVRVKYNLRDLDGSANNSVQAVALQYRSGNSGNFTNLPAGFVPDATTGPSIATLVTPVNVLLPPDCNNRPQVQVRIITCNANGTDEWVGVDDIEVLAESQIPLPVGLSGLQAVRDGDSIRLKWQAYSEQHNSGFGIEYATDGSHFQATGFLPSLSPDGNSVTPLQYNYTFRNDAPLLFIRLKQTDQDGHSVYSGVVKVSADVADQFRIIKVFPVPFINTMNVSVMIPHKGSYRLTVMDISGKQMLVKDHYFDQGVQEWQEDLSGLPKGILLLLIADKERSVQQTMRIMKE